MGPTAVIGENGEPRCLRRKHRKCASRSCGAATTASCEYLGAGGLRGTGSHDVVVEEPARSARSNGTPTDPSTLDSPPAGDLPDHLLDGCGVWRPQTSGVGPVGFDTLVESRRPRSHPIPASGSVERPQVLEGNYTAHRRARPGARLSARAPTSSGNSWPLPSPLRSTVSRHCGGQDITPPKRAELRL